MLHKMRCAVAAALLAVAPISALASEAGDLIFSQRAPWQLGTQTLQWQLTRQGPDLPTFQTAKDGSVTLAEVTDPKDGKPALEMVQHFDKGERKIGPLPLSTGDPVLVYFLESTARDMATLTGGSADYIRNRIKDAVFRGGEVTRADGKIVAEMEPFTNDANKNRMGGFSTLKLTFVLADDPKAPIREMIAETAQPVEALIPRELAGLTVAPAVYRNALVMK